LLLFALGAGLVLRVAVEAAYRPALFYTDSWAYVASAYGGHLMVDPLHSVGYPIMLKLLGLAGHDLLVITAPQHLAGLATGALVYWVLLALGVRRSLAALAAALMLVDSYAITLEQKVLSEPFFTLSMLASLCLTATAGGRRSRLIGGGLLLAAATVIRPVALFAVPVWLVYLLWLQPGRNLVLAGTLAAVLPLLAYGAAHQAKAHEFGLTSGTGWQLYGRVAGITDPVSGRSPLFYIFDPRSPARQRYGFSSDPVQLAHSDKALRRDALAVIAHHPLAYARTVGSDFLRYFEPGAMGGDTEDRAVALPSSPREVSINATVGSRWFPHYAPQVRSPAALLRTYADAIHTPRWALGPLSLLGLLTLTLPLLRPGRIAPAPHRREIFLLLGSALAMLLGSAAVSNFAIRYLVPVVPIMLAGGVLAVSDLGFQLGRNKVRVPVQTPKSRPALEYLP
jgi:4-amino-4-deoxy-L-arabinose transferase-like glycosyltransferase